jgi:transposase
MAQRVDPTKHRADGTPIEPLSIKHPNAAGVDIGGSSHYVAVPPDRVGKGEHAVREFGPHTEDLVAVADWLCACRIDTIALESTGVYWIALYELLQARGFDVWLVDAKSVHHVKARKSDVLDCQWLQQLHSFGLLCRAHRPDEPVCALREMSQLRDITGETGMKIIRAIVADGRCQASCRLNF